MAPLATLHGSVDVTLRDGLLPIPDGFAVPFAAGVVVTAWLDGCLALWPRAAWERLAERILALPIGDARARTFGRLVFASVVELAALPRSIPLSPSQRQAAAVDERGVLVGAGDHAELWSPERWAALASRPLDTVADVLRP